MALYRKVQMTFWQDPWILNLDPLERYFYLYLLTNSKTTLCGVYEISIKALSFETGLTEEKILGLIQKFDSIKKILYDCVTKEVFILNWLKHNNSNSSKYLKHMHEETKMIKSESFRLEIKNKLEEYKYSMDNVSLVKDNSKSKKKS